MRRSLWSYVDEILAARDGWALYSIITSRIIKTRDGIELSAGLNLGPGATPHHVFVSLPSNALAHRELARAGYQMYEGDGSLVAERWLKNARELTSEARRWEEIASGSAGLSDLPTRRIRGRGDRNASFPTRMVPVLRALTDWPLTCVGAAIRSRGLFPEEPSWGVSAWAFIDIDPWTAHRSAGVEVYPTGRRRASLNDWNRMARKLRAALAGEGYERAQVRTTENEVLPTCRFEKSVPSDAALQRERRHLAALVTARNKAKAQRESLP